MPARQQSAVPSRNPSLSSSPSGHRNPQRRRDIARGLGALLVLLLLAVGLPALVAGFTGVPSISQPPTASGLRQLLTGPDTGQLIADVLGVVFWTGWALFVVLLTLETFARVRRRRPLRLPALGPLQDLAGTLIACVALLSVPAAVHLSIPFAAPPSRLPPLAAAAHQHAAGHAAAQAPPAHSRDPSQPGRPPEPATTPARRPASLRPGPPPVVAPTRYEVRAMHDGQRDTLWRIAEQHLRDPLRWPEIYHLNAGRPQPDGGTLTDPHWIRPGWQLLLPADATDLAAPAQTTTAPAGPAGSAAPTYHAQPTPASAPASRRAATPAWDDPAVAHPATPPPPSGARPAAAPPAAPTPEAPVAGLARPAPPRPAAPAPDHAASQAQPAAAHSGIVAEIRQDTLVGASLATGLAAALELRRRRKRRAYRPSPPQPVSLASSPPLPAALHRLLAADHDESDDDTENPDGDEGGELDAPNTGLSATAGRRATGAAPDGGPADVPIGHRGNTPVSLDLLAQPGVAVCGTGAPGVLRHLLATLLASARNYGLTVLVTADVRDRLLPGARQLVPVRTVATAEEALVELQTAVLARTRRFHDADTADLAAYRRGHPEDPMPLVILVAGPIPAAISPGLTAVLAAGQALGITAVLLGGVNGANTGTTELLVAGDGTASWATSPAPGQPSLEGVRLFRLTGTDAVTALEVLSGDQSSTEPEVDAAAEEPAATPPRDANSPPAGQSAADPPAPGPVTVHVLGPYQISAWDREITSGLRRTAKELLLYYLLHPGGATAEAAIEALWPEADAERGRQRFWTALGNLRTRLRSPSAEADVAVIAKQGEHYRIQDGLLTADLWNFQTALRDAQQAAGEAAEAEILARAAASYKGDLAGELGYWWVETAREELHQAALHTFTRLAELHSHTGRLPDAIACLQRAVALDPHAEHAYRQLIRAQTAAGRPDEARRTYRQLVGRLADIDLEPDDDTETLIAELRPPSRTTPPAARPQSTGRPPSN